jgi:hypothetical protein
MEYAPGLEMVVVAVVVVLVGGAGADADAEDGVVELVDCNAG